jgi:hypothetical protein
MRLITNGSKLHNTSRLCNDTYNKKSKRNTTNLYFVLEFDQNSPKKGKAKNSKKPPGPIVAFFSYCIK